MTTRETDENLWEKVAPIAVNTEDVWESLPGIGNGSNGWKFSFLTTITKSHMAQGFGRVANYLSMFERAVGN